MPAAMVGVPGLPVVCVRGPSRSGKTSVCERLIPFLAERNVRAAWVKRTHHQLDLPHKASTRIWTAGPVAMAVRTSDRVQLTLPPASGDVTELLATLPQGVDVVLLETHSPEPFPAIVAAVVEPAAGEKVIGRWALETLEGEIAGLGAAVLATLPEDIGLARALRAASALHGSHGCAGVVLGARLALSGVGALGIDWPDTKKRLLVTAETDRCAVDALQAITGCRPGKRTLRLLDYGKLAATFVDTWTDRAVRVAVRGEAREVAEAMEPGTAEDRHERQRRAYLTMPHSQLFTKTAVSAAVSQFDLPGPPRRRVLCAQCREEVSDGREVVTDGGTFCRPCAVVRDSQ